MSQIVTSNERPLKTIVTVTGQSKFSPKRNKRHFGIREHGKNCDCTSKKIVEENQKRREREFEEWLKIKGNKQKLREWEKSHKNRKVTDLDLLNAITPRRGPDPEWYLAS